MALPIMARNHRLASSSRTYVPVASGAEPCRTQRPQRPAILHAVHHQQPADVFLLDDDGCRAVVTIAEAAPLMLLVIPGATCF